MKAALSVFTLALWAGLAACASNHTAPAALTGSDRQACAAAAGDARWDRAIEVCTIVLHAGGMSDDEIADTLLDRARGYSGKRDFWRAWEDLDHAVKLAPGSAEVHARRADELAREAKYDEALQDYDAAIHISPRADYYVARGLTLLNVDRMDPAIFDFNSALALVPNADTVYAMRAWAFDRLGDRVHAAQDVDQALRLNPGNADAAVLRGIFDLERNDFDHGVSVLEQATHDHPRDARAYAALGLAHDLREEPDQALAALDTSIDLDPNDWRAYLYRAKARSLAGDEAGMKDDCQAATLRAGYEKRTPEFRIGGGWFRCEAP